MIQLLRYIQRSKSCRIPDFFLFEQGKDGGEGGRGRGGGGEGGKEEETCFTALRSKSALKKSYMLWKQLNVFLCIQAWLWHSKPYIISKNLIILFGQSKGNTDRTNLQDQKVPASFNSFLVFTLPCTYLINFSHSSSLCFS